MKCIFENSLLRQKKSNLPDANTDSESHHAASSHDHLFVRLVENVHKIVLVVFLGPHWHQHEGFNATISDNRLRVSESSTNIKCMKV